MTTTFSTLKTYVADVLDRSDISAVGGPIDTWIGLVENEIYRDCRLRFMEASTSVAISSGVIAIPASFLEIKSARLVDTANIRLGPKDADWIYANYPLRSADGAPRFIAPEGDNFIFGPFPDSDYTVNLQYYARPTALSTSNETNWLTTNASDVLLYGTLLQSIPYLGMDDRAEFWDARYRNGKEEIQEQNKSERFPEEVSLRVTPG